MTNAKTGKVERVFVNLAAVYPNPNDPNEEFSFEEMRARSRGWLNKDWGAERREAKQATSIAAPIPHSVPSPTAATDDIDGHTQNFQPVAGASGGSGDRMEATSCKGVAQEGKPVRPKKMKVMEVKGETQTSRFGTPRLI